MRQDRRPTGVTSRRRGHNSGMVSYPGAEQFVPRSTRIPELATAAQDCRGCDLYARATQTVFGAGRRTARLMLVGEQPGDVEDRQGVPFVGPAGHVLDRALADAGIDRAATYLTNAVKHFRWKSTDRSSRRLHDKPSAAQANACQPWLAAELAAVKPRVLVALGATAAASLFGSSFRLTQHRGALLAWPPASGAFVDDRTRVEIAIATIHPSAVLRATSAERDLTYQGLVDDLRRIADRQ
jgi:uracil-DNA glycosylase